MNWKRKSERNWGRLGMKYDENSLYDIKSSMEGKRFSLFDLAIWKNGLAFKKINFSETGVPVIKISELKNGISGTTAYTQQKFPETVHLNKGDLLFSWSGNPQTSIDVFRFNLEEGWLNQHIFKVTPDENIVDRNYFYFLMKNLKPHFTQIATNKQTTGLGHVTISDIKRMSVIIPSIDLQRKIVSYIKPIDDKIVLNNEINNNLLQQAEALFKKRFLSCNELPFGWARMALGDISDMSAGGDKPQIISNQKTEEHQYPVYSNGISDEGLYGFTTDYKISAESVTVSARGTIGFVCLRHIPYTPIVRLVTLVPHTNIVSAKYLYLWLKSVPIHGTGTTQQQLTVPDFRKTEILIPPKADMREFTETVNSLFQQVWANQEENTKLADIRDTLLPRLMSGELDVSSIEI